MNTSSFGKQVAQELVTMAAVVGVTVALMSSCAHSQEPSAPPPLGWVYGRYLRCYDSACVVSVQADGVNVRDQPDGRAFLALVNGTPLVPLQNFGRWVLVAPACELAPTGVWSDTHNVPLGACR